MGVCPPKLRHDISHRLSTHGAENRMDIIADAGIFFMGTHKGASADHNPIRITFPPTTQPQLLESFIYAPFNKREYAIPLSPHHKEFAFSGCRASSPASVATSTRPHRAQCVCNIHRKGKDVEVTVGAGVYDTAGLCPPFFSSNSNAFASIFGIE